MTILPLAAFKWIKAKGHLYAYLEDLDLHTFPKEFKVKSPVTGVIVTFKFDEDEYCAMEGYDGEPIMPYKVTAWTGTNRPVSVKTATLSKYEAC